MTVRLIGLMSVVLLLSLTAFGLSVNYYQDQLMEEVARTASAVGKATLKTFEFPGQSAGRPSVKGELLVWAGGSLPFDGHMQVSEDVADCITVERLGFPTMVLEGAGPENGGSGSSGHHFVIRINDIHTESVDDGEMILTIPRVEGLDSEELRNYAFTRSFSTSEAGMWTADFVSDTLGGPDLRALRLPINTQDYRKLFGEMRSRSLFLFLGVFLVGTALSAGLATRFTRPIRKLDEGLRKISDGDLDVEVPAEGRDEMARLGMAFNEMTRRLRAGRERSRELVRREKLTAVGRLAAGVAHDVRNPLHSIGLTLEYLQDSFRPPDGEREQDFDRSVAIIRGEIRRLDRLVANFLRFTTHEGGERQQVDVGELLEETAQLVRKEAEWRNVKVTVKIDDGRTTLWGDSEALRSSILNLVLNSFEAMPEGGQLDLTLRSQGDELVIEVIDDGRGISEENREKVFEFGYTTREGGNGLGLAMVHQIVVEDHGGHIRMESQPGAGTTVRMIFPRDVQSTTGDAA